jgi:cytochrome c oxidase assembly factor CtaG
MSGATQAIAASWSIDPWLTIALTAVAFIYARGRRILVRARRDRFPAWRFLAFLGGLLAFWLALASPVEALSGFLLSAHMIQHLLLMSVAPPLLLLGAPLLPLLRGLPREFAHDGIGPFLNWQPLRRLGRFLTYPPVCWLLMVASLCGWHLPVLFDLALRSPGWHKVEHACFFGASLLFWWPVVRPYPMRSQWPLWAMPLYLLSADIVNSALCGALAFSERALYTAYQAAPRLFGTTALSDQVAAAVIMWVPGSVLYLVPAVLLAFEYLSPRQRLVRPARPIAPPPAHAGGGVMALLPAWWPKPAAAHAVGRGASVTRGMPVANALPLGARVSAMATVSFGGVAAPSMLIASPPAGPFDLLRVPVLGRFIGSLAGRRILQIALLLTAIVVIVDGLIGPQLSAANLAGVVPWTWWRALTVVGLLAFGNVFCMACPFMLPRDLGKRLGVKTRNWPRLLRSKWLAIGLLILFFWAYEAFGLWDRPIWTAWLVVNYFVAAFVVDAFFRGATFCKYLCPIGQFQFINSLISPFEVKVREPAACAGCRTHDCLRGNEKHRGCETDLFLPRKVGNLDCTFCLDCARACPHGNVGLLADFSARGLIRDPERSSIGRLSRRLDVAILALVLVFAAFASAGAMTAPVSRWLAAVTFQMGFASSVPAVTAYFAVALVLLPLAIAWAAGRAGKPADGSIAASTLVGRFAPTLIPLGAAMWAAHFLFHLVAGYGATWPLLQQTFGEWGFHLLGTPDWNSAAVPMGMNAVLVWQMLLLDAGLLFSLYLAWRVSREIARPGAAAVRSFVPWAFTALVLYGLGVWIFLQPMQMRGLAAASM